VFASPTQTQLAPTDFLIEDTEALGHEVAHVGEVEEREWNADKCVDDRYKSTPFRLRSHVTIACKPTSHIPVLQ